MYHVET